MATRQKNKLMTKEMLEKAVERQLNAANRAFMRGDLSKEKYDALIRDIDTWSKEQLRYCR